MKTKSIRILSTLLAVMVVFGLTACGGNNGSGTSASNQVSTDPTENPTSTPTGNVTNETVSTSTFDNGVLKTDRLKIEITDYKVIEAENKYVPPLLAIWFSVTNFTDSALKPGSAWSSRITGYLDESLENRLSLTNVPDDPLNDYLDIVIAKGDTVQCCIAYMIKDDTTLVMLVGSESAGGPVIGTMTLDLSGR
jgi:hypothetical protein